MQLLKLHNETKNLKEVETKILKENLCLHGRLSYTPSVIFKNTLRSKLHECLDAFESLGCRFLY